MKKYKPYKGGGGPTDKQQEDNTKFLAELLTLIEVPFKENRSRMKEQYSGKDILLLEIKMSKNTMYIGYDRWGFVLENEKNTLYPFEDQASLQDTLLTILKYYKR